MKRFRLGFLFLIMVPGLSVAHTLMHVCNSVFKSNLLVFGRYQNLDSRSFLQKTHRPKIYYVAGHLGLAKLTKYMNHHNLDGSDLSIALYYATEARSIPKMEYILAHGASVNGLTPGGDTAFDVAVQCNFVQGAEFLLKRSANPNLPHSGAGPFNFALANKNYKLASIILGSGYKMELDAKRCESTKWIAKKNADSIPPALLKEIVAAKCH